MPDTSFIQKKKNRNIYFESLRKCVKFLTGPWAASASRLLPIN